MTAKIIAMPIAAAVGASHVSIAQCSTGWAVMVWDRENGPRMVGKPTAYDTAVKAAKACAERFCAVLDLPENTGLIHVRMMGGEYVVEHESSSGESFAILDRFGPHGREDAVLYAISRLYHYQPCRLGEVAS